MIWAELLRSEHPFSDSSRSQAAYPVAELHCGSLLTALTAPPDLSPQKWSCVGLPLPGRPRDMTIVSLLSPIQALGTNCEDCFSSPCSSFKFLVLCPVTPLIATHPRLLSMFSIPCVFNRCMDRVNFFQMTNRMAELAGGKAGIYPTASHLNSCYLLALCDVLGT